jgi:signal transduction histidine kinase
VELARMRKEMVTTVSHELRTPLTIIQGAMATLSRRWDVLTEPERLDLVDVLIDNVASLDSSILHFVDAARLERGEFVLNPEWVDVTQTVARIRTKLTTVLSGHEVQLELNVNRVWADAPSFGRIAEHLLVNAVRFSPIGLPIRVRTELQGAEVLFSVTDRGPGIPPHLMSTLWIPLERGDVSETGVSRGAGLGLPIVRELARLHGGDADLRTAKHRGTTVTVRLPLPPGSSAIEQLTELPRSARRGRAGRRAAGAGR